MSAPLRPPGPRSRFLIGTLPERWCDWLEFFPRCAAEYGDVVHLKLGPVHAALVTSPEATERVLVTEHRTFNRQHFALRRNRLLFGEGLLTSEGETWRRQRRAAQPAFRRERLARYGPVAVDEARRLAAAWEGGETRDIHHEMERLLGRISARLVLGVDLTRDRALGKTIDDAMDAFFARSDADWLIPEWIPTVKNLRLRRAVRRLKRRLGEAFAHPEPEGEGFAPILATIAQQLDDGSVGDSRRELRDAAITLLQAGRHTTAAALTWTWLLLSEHPEVHEALRAEIATALDRRLPTTEDLPRLPLAGAIARESLRLYPPVWAMSRHVVADTEVGGFHVPAGWTVILCPWVVHRDPRWYAEPAAFRPTRWLDGLDRRLPRFAFFPFGGGPRLCIGDSLAMTVIVLLLAALGRDFAFERPGGLAVEPLPGFTLRPRGGLPLIVRRRAG